MTVALNLGESPGIDITMKCVASVLDSSTMVIDKHTSQGVEGNDTLKANQDAALSVMSDSVDVSNTEN